MKPQNAFRLLLPLMGMLMLAQGAFAVCSSPTGTGGDMTYSTSANVMAYCDGTNWISMNGGVSLTVNTSGGGVTPYGTTNDIQINNGGTLGGDTGTFTYNPGTDTLSVPNVSATAISAINQGTFGGLLVNGGAAITGVSSLTTVSASTISVTTLQVGAAGTCASGTAGTLRYNTTSNTMDYCSGTAWLSLGPSGTTIPAFSVYRSTTQTGGVNIKILMDTKKFDTYNNYDLSTNKFTPTVAGKYIFTGFILCTAGNSQFVLYKNGSIYQYGGPIAAANDRSYITALVDMNGTTDYVEPYGYCSNGASSNFGGSSMNGFAGALIASAAAGGGGTATPAGSTGDVQFNTSGALDADTGLFYWDKSNHRLGLGTGSPSRTIDVSGSMRTYGTTNGLELNTGNTGSGIGAFLTFNIPTKVTSLQSVEQGVQYLPILLNPNGGTVGIGTASSPSVKLDVAGEIKVGSTGAACSSSISGSIRYNTTSNTIDYCSGSAWRSLNTASGTATLGLLAYSAGTQSIPNSTVTTLTDLTTVSRNDFGASSLSAGVFTVPSGLGGWYHISGHYNVNACSTSVVIFILVNNAISFQSGDVDNNTGACADRVSTEGSIYLSAGDTVKLQVSQISGAAHNTTTYASLGIVRLPDGITNGGSGASATPAGSTNDVQYNSGGALAADTGNFTYASSVLKAPTISSTYLYSQYLSATTIYNPGSFSGNTAALNSVSSTAVSASAVSVTTLQLGAGGTCATGTAGAVRYNTTSNTVDYCTGTAWMSMGPSSTQPIAFHYESNVAQSLTTATNVKMIFGTKLFDTNNNVSSSRFTVTVPGKYLLSAQIDMNYGAALDTFIMIYKNGTAYKWGNRFSSAWASPNITTIVDAVAGDYFEVFAFQGSGTTVATSALGARDYFDGVLLAPQGSGSGGSASPAGSTNDIQFNNAGALAADTGNFTYTTSGGLLKVTNVSATANLSAAGQGTFGSLLVNGGATVTGLSSLTTVSASTISSTLLQLSANTTATCSAGLAGAQRYNSVSNTMDYCTGSAWMSLGPSATAVPAFSVNRGGTNQTVTTQAAVSLTWTTKAFDTNNNFNLVTGQFTPTIPGKYLLTLLALCNDATIYCDVSIRKNGSLYSEANINPGTGTGRNQSAFATAIVDMNGTTDNVSAYVNNGGGTVINGNAAYTYFQGSLLTMNGGGSGGSATPAGSTNDVQYNSGGALAADTGNFTYAGGVLQAPTVSASGISGTLIQAGQSTATCTAGVNGSMRYNSTSNTLQICLGSTWTSLSSNTTSTGTLTGTGSATAIAFWNGASALTYDSSASYGVYYDNINKRLGVGTNAPSSTVTALVPTSASIADFYAGNGSNGSYARLGAFGNGGAMTVGDPSGTTQAIIRAYAIGGTQAYFLAGNIGIGTTAANSSLTVVGEAQVGSSGVACVTATNGGAIRYSAGTLYYCNGANTWAALASGGTPAGSTGDIQYNNGGAFAADTGQLDWDATNNRLGVGTGSPSSTLHVYNSAGDSQLQVGVATTGTFANIKLVPGTGVSWTIGTQQNYLSNALLFRPGAAGSEALTITTGGLVGIGTTAPTGQVHAYMNSAGSTTSVLSEQHASTGYAVVRTLNDVGNFMGIGTQSSGSGGLAFLEVSSGNPMTFWTGNGERMRIDNSGNVAIGATSVSNSDVWNKVLNVNGSGHSKIIATAGTIENGIYAHTTGFGGSLAGGLVGTRSNHPLTFMTNGTQKMTLDAAGNLAIGTTTTSNASLTVAGSVSTTGEMSSNFTGSSGQFRAVAGNYGVIFRNDGANFYTLLTASGSPYGGWNTLRPQTINLSTGDVTFGTNVTAAAFLYSSDKRLKSDITPLTNGLTKLDALNPVSFLFTAEPSKTVHLGLIAQDVQKVYPEAVKTDDKGFLKLDYPALIGPIVDMLKELKAIVLGDHDDIAKLKAANDNLEKQLKAANDNQANDRAMLRSILRDMEQLKHGSVGLKGRHGG